MTHPTETPSVPRDTRGSTRRVPSIRISRTIAPRVGGAATAGAAAARQAITRRLKDPTRPSLDGVGALADRPVEPREAARAGVAGHAGILDLDLYALRPSR